MPLCRQERTSAGTCGVRVLATRGFGWAASAAGSCDDLGDTGAAHEYYESLRHALFRGQCCSLVNLDDLGTAVSSYERLRRWFKRRVLKEPHVEEQLARPATSQRRYFRIVRTSTRSSSYDPPDEIAVAKVRALQGQVNDLGSTVSSWLSI